MVDDTRKMNVPSLRDSMVLQGRQKLRLHHRLNGYLSWKHTNVITRRFMLSLIETSQGRTRCASSDYGRQIFLHGKHGAISNSRDPRRPSPLHPHKPVWVPIWNSGLLNASAAPFIVYEQSSASRAQMPYPAFVAFCSRLVYNVCEGK